MSLLGNAPFSHGWHPDLEDYDAIAKLPSIPFTMEDVRCAIGDAVVKRFDPRGKLKIENQGQMGSCEGHSLSTIMEVLNFFVSGEWEQISRLFTYLMTREYAKEPWDDAGASILDGMKMAHDVGVVYEKDFPYKSAFPTRAWFLSELKRLATADRFKIGSYYGVRSYDELFAWLSAKAGCISMAVSWNPSLDSKGRCLKFTPSLGPRPSWHAIPGVFLADDVLDEDGNPCIGIPNSHGINFGVAGYMFVGKSWINNCLAYRGSAMIATSHLLRPGPKPWDIMNDMIQVL